MYKYNLDLMAYNGKVITMNRANEIAEAFAIKNGKIFAIGTNDEIEKLVKNDTKRIDLQQKTVTPGLIDTHIHVASLGSIGAGAGLAFIESKRVLDISHANSIDEIVLIISNQAKRSKKGEWIITGWPNAAISEKKKITCWDIDPVSPKNPVMISGYPYAVVNSYLLKKAKITKDTVSPPGGEIEKDPITGEPTGALAFQAVYRLLPSPPQPSVKDTEEAIKKVQKNFLAEGLTTYKDAGLRKNSIKAYNNLEERNELICRTQMVYTWLWTIEEASQAVLDIIPCKSDKLTFFSVKLSLDGGISSRTAWSYEDWNKDYNFLDTDNKGYWKIPPHDLQEMVQILHNAGLQICCHCCGDKAIDVYLDAIENAYVNNPEIENRHTIIHCNLPTKKAIKRISDLGNKIAIEAQAPWLSDDNRAAACGPERSKRFLPFKTWLDKGIIVGNGCDYPPKPFPPRLGLWSACTREVEKGKYGRYPYGTEECLTIQEALYTYTMGGAKCLLMEDQIGSLELGKFADFVVWDTDLYSASVEEIKYARVVLTAVNGEILYKR